MKKKLNPILIILIVLAIAGLSCKMLSGEEATETPTAAPTRLSPTATIAQATQGDATPTEETELTPKDTSEKPDGPPETEELYRFEKGGFAFRVVSEWELDEDENYVTLIAPGGDLDVGPAMMFTFEIGDEDTTLDEMYDSFISGAEDDGNVTVEEPENVIVDGFPGLRGAVTGEEQGQKMRGEVLMSMVAPRQFFLMMAIAPADRWENEMASILEGVIDSLQLFEIEIADDNSQDGTNYLGSEQTSPGGYFTYQTLSGYQVEQISNGVKLITSESDPDLGPVVILTEPETVEGVYPSELIFMYEGEDRYISNDREIVVDGMDGVTADYDRQNGAVIGQAVVVPIDATHHFMALAYAPADIWENELSDQFQVLIASVQFTASSTLSGELIHQWAVAAEATSEYTSDDWAAFQATGEPDTPDCGDQGTAWASLEGYSSETLTLFYETPVIPTEINFVQTYNPDQVIMIEVIDLYGNYEDWPVYFGSPVETDECPYTLSVDVVGIDYPISGVRVTIDQSILGLGWNEIDAVELVGYLEDNSSTNLDGDLEIWENIYALPIFPGAENVSYADDLVLSFTVSDADKDDVLEYLFDELKAIGWVLDVDEDGKCRDDSRCTSEIMGLDYGDAENAIWFLIHTDSDDAILFLTVYESSGIVGVGMSLGE